MRKSFKNNYGVVSPLEFTIASMALISTLVVVTASMAPPVEQASAQYYADANVKATEIMSILLTSESEVGLVIEPETSVPIPPTESITDITILNSPPYADNPSPGNGDNVLLGPLNSIELSVAVHDVDEEEDQELNVSFYAESGELIGEDFGVNNHGRASFTWVGLSPGAYKWYVTVNDSKPFGNSTSDKWSFTATIPPPNEPPETPTIPGCPSEVCPMEYVTGEEYSFETSTTDPEGDDVYYMWDWGDGEISDWLGPNRSGYDVEASNIWNSADTYAIRVKAKDIHGAWNGQWSDPKVITVEGNLAPIIFAGPTGPTSEIIIGVTECVYSVSAGDPDGDMVRIGWDWDGDKIVDEFTIYSNFNPMSATHVWSESSETQPGGVYRVMAIPQDDNHSAFGDWSEILEVTVEGEPPENNPPEIPSKPDGPQEIEEDKLADFTTATLDGPPPEGDLVRIGWDWDGDIIVDEWTSYRLPEGEEYLTSHFWSSPGAYEVRAIAEDRQGVRSRDWSEPFFVNVVASGEIEDGGKQLQCFLAGTKIEMADGSQKNIEDIQIGDIVKSYDEKTHIFTKDRVVQIFHDPPDKMISNYYLVLNNDLGITPDHPLYINGQWISAGKLKIGEALLKGKIDTLKKIYKKVPTYNFETEKYHTYLVIFGDNIVIAHNAARTYILVGNEEEISFSRQTSVTENDYTALLSMDKIYELSELPYQDLKDILDLSDEYDFFVTIGNSEAIYLNYVPDQSVSLDSANVVVTCRENIIIVDSAGYAYATITVTVVK